MFHSPTYRWFPAYTTYGSNPKTNIVAGVECDECPASLITPDSKFLVQLEAENHLMKDSTGAALFGLDSGQWPACWADAVVVIAAARIAESNARQG